MLNLIYRLAAPLVRACAGRTLFAATACISFAATAQAAERDPLNAQTAVPSFPYQSAFSYYKPYQDPELMSWKTANDVVREFGSMATMGDMSDGGNPDPTDAKPGGGEQANPPAKPAHDMSNMRPETPAPASKKPASSSKPEMKNMPGHDMSKMQKAPTASATKPSPPPGKPAAPAPMPGHGGMSH